MGSKSDIAWLYFACRRGTKELDLLLQRFLDEEYLEITTRCQQAFRALLELQDPELNDLIFHQKEPENRDIADVVRRIRQYR